MEYTKSAPLKLRAIGFEFFYSHKSTTTNDPLHYEVWRKGIIDVTIEHVPGKKVIIDITETDGVKCNSIDQLVMLDEMINVEN